MKTLHSLKRIKTYPFLTAAQKRGIVNFQDEYDNQYPVTVTTEFPPQIFFLERNQLQTFYNAPNWTGLRGQSNREFSWENIIIKNSVHPSEIGR